MGRAADGAIANLGPIFRRPTRRRTRSCSSRWLLLVSAYSPALTLCCNRSPNGHGSTLHNKPGSNSGLGEGREDFRRPTKRNVEEGMGLDGDTAAHVTGDGWVKRDSPGRGEMGPDYQKATVHRGMELGMKKSEYIMGAE